MTLKNKLEEIKITSDCYLNLFVAIDDSAYILEINYLDGQFVAERQFPVSPNGIEGLEETKSLYRNENDFKRHFGII
jgi:hypothetical protein